MNLLYRFRQFWRVINAEPLPDEARIAVAEVLDEPEQDVFYGCSLGDQWHGFRVFITLREAGEEDPDLLAAALLHDAGKSREHLSVWGRTWIVVGEVLMPARVDRWAENGQSWWQRPFVVRKYHPQWGADMVRQAGSRPMTIALIQRHQDPLSGSRDTDEDELLRKLKWADGLN